MANNLVATSWWNLILKACDSSILPCIGFSKKNGVPINVISIQTKTNAGLNSSTQSR